MTPWITWSESTTTTGLPSKLIPPSSVLAAIWQFVVEETLGEKTILLTDCTGHEGALVFTFSLHCAEPFSKTCKLRHSTTSCTVWCRCLLNLAGGGVRVRNDCIRKSCFLVQDGTKQPAQWLYCIGSPCCLPLSRAAQVILGSLRSH